MKDTEIWLRIFESVGSLPTSVGLSAYQVAERASGLYKMLMQEDKGKA